MGWDKVIGKPSMGRLGLSGCLSTKKEEIPQSNQKPQTQNIPKRVMPQDPIYSLTGPSQPHFTPLRRTQNTDECPLKEQNVNQNLAKAKPTRSPTVKCI